MRFLNNKTIIDIKQTYYLTLQREKKDIYFHKTSSYFTDSEGKYSTWRFGHEKLSQVQEF